MIEAPAAIDFGPEWAEARSRVETYLRALRLVTPEQEGEIVSKVLEKAAAEYANDSSACPATLAMNELHNLSENWFSQLLHTQDRPEARGIASLLAIDATEKWPSAFLSGDVPQELRQLVEQCNLRGTPELQLSRMVPQPFETPLPESTLKHLARGLQPLTTKLFAFVFSVLSLFYGRLSR